MRPPNVSHVDCLGGPVAIHSRWTISFKPHKALTQTNRSIQRCQRKLSILCIGILGFGPAVVFGWVISPNVSEGSLGLRQASPKHKIQSIRMHARDFGSPNCSDVDYLGSLIVIHSSRATSSKRTQSVRLNALINPEISKTRQFYSFSFLGFGPAVFLAELYLLMRVWCSFVKEHLRVI